MNKNYISPLPLSSRWGAEERGIKKRKRKKKRIEEKVKTEKERKKIEKS